MAKEEPTEEVVEETDDLRSQLEEAFVDEPEEETVEAEAETEEKATSEEAIAEDEPAEDKEDEQPEPDGIAEINAPIGFSPESREIWKDVPEAIKLEVQKREKEITEAMANSGESRRTHQAITDLAQSYAPILAAEGAETPMQAIEGLFRTVAELRVGSPQQVASKMADLIGHYGVDISLLDQALAGSPAADPETAKLEQLLDSRLAPLQSLLTEQQQSRTSQEEQAKTAVQQELAEFAQNAEFLADVRYDMADFIDNASKQGRKMDFKEAYDKACAMNPSISKVLSDRAEAERLKAAGETIQGKKEASSSIRSNSGNPDTSATPETLRDEIANLWDEATG